MPSKNVWGSIRWWLRGIWTTKVNVIVVVGNDGRFIGGRPGAMPGFIELRWETEYPEGEVAGYGL